MKKSLSLLVAIAMVFSMFSAVAAAASESGTKLQGLGVIKGNQNGDLLEDANWLRQDVAVLMSRLAGKETEAKATAKSHTFTDVRGTFYDGYISWAKENNFMQGNSATNFGFDNEITYKEFATVILRALGVDTSDYSKIGELAIAAGIIDDKLNLDEKAVRGVTYDIITTALDKEVDGQKLGTKLGLPGYEVVAPAIAAKATGAKVVTVTFNKAIDTDKAVFTVKRGAVDVKVAKKTFSEDKKTAILELDSKILAGEYTVNAKDAVGDELSATFTAEAEKVAAIEFVGDKLATNENRSEASVTYKVVNQYDEDITSTNGSSITWSASKGQVSTSAGKLTLKPRAGATTTSDFFTVTEKIIITGIHTSGSASVSATLEVGFPARLDSVTVKELYHPEGKTIATGVDFSEFVLLIDAKDQYGNKIDATKFEDEVVKMTSRIDIFTLGKAKDNQGKNKDSLGVPLAGPDSNFQSNATGVNTISFISKYSTSKTTFDVDVDKGKVVEKFEIQQPSTYVAAGDGKVKLPFVALDGQGNRVTKFEDLNGKITFSPEADLQLVRDSVTKDAVLEYKTPDKLTQEQRVVLVATVKGTVNVVQTFIDIKPNGVPTEIRTLDYNTNVVQGAEIKFKPEKIKLIDQHGRTLDGKKAIEKGYVLQVSGKNLDNGVTVTPAVNITSNDTDIVVNYGTLAKTDGTITVKVGKVAADSTFDGIHSKDFSFSVVEASKVSNYSVADISKTNVNQKAEVKLTARATGSSENVTVPAADYDVTTPSGVSAAKDGDKYLISFDQKVLFKDEVEKQVTITIRPFAGTSVIEKTFTVENQALKVSKFEFKDSVKNGAITVAAANTVNVQKAITDNVKLFDQNGKEITSTENLDALRIVADVSKTAQGVTVDGNRSGSTTVTGSIGNSFTVKVFIDNVDFELEVKVLGS